MYQNISVGCDPEFFLKDKTGFIGAFNFLKGTKWKPENIDDQGSAILHDNVMVEFNTAPALNKGAFVANVNKVLEHLRGKLPSDLEFSFLPSAHFNMDRLTAVEALVFGCEPDFNAWFDGMQNPPIGAVDPTLRTSGGHIHVGYDNPNKENRLVLMQGMDIFLGVPSILLDEHGDERRSMYGQAGAFRPKPYGAEYRVLSNFWIQSDRLKEWAYEATIMCAERLNDGFVLDVESDIDKVLNCINNNDKCLAEQLVSKYNLPMV